MDDPEFTQKYQRLKNARKFYRINHLSWWEQELPAEHEITAAYETLCAYGKKVDYVLSHCAPSKMQRRIQARIGDGTHPKNTLTEFLQWVYDECEFKHWYCGHYHQPMDITRCFHVVYKNFVRLNDMRTIDGNYEKRNKEFIDRLISILSNNKPAEL